MQTVTLQMDDAVYEKFSWLLNHFSRQEIKIIDHSEYETDEVYLRSINGMEESLLEARAEPKEIGVALENLEW